MKPKVLIILGGDLDDELLPKYQAAVEQETMEIVGCARLTKKGLTLEPPVKGPVQLQYVLVSASKLYPYLEYLAKAVPNLPSENIIDGRIFRMPGLDVPRLFTEKCGYAPLHQLDSNGRTESFWDLTRANLPRMWHRDSRTVELGPKTYFAGQIEWGYRVGSTQTVSFGNYTSCAGHITLELGLNNQHDYHRVSVYDPGCLDWSPWQEVGYSDTGGGYTNRFRCLDRARLPVEIGRRLWRVDDRQRRSPRIGQRHCQGCSTICHRRRQSRESHQVPLRVGHHRRLAESPLVGLGHEADS